MSKIRATIILINILGITAFIPAVHAGRHDLVNIWLRNFTSYEYSVVINGPSPFLMADSSHATSSKVHAGPPGRYGYVITRQDGFTFRGDVFAPRDTTIIFTLTDGPGVHPQLTVSRINSSPFGQGMSTSTVFSAMVANEPGASSGSTSSAVFVPAPPPTATQTVLTRNNTYVVQPGDTLPKIAALVGMWPSVVAYMNGVPSGNIWPGQVIQFRTYTVVPGDTFFSVASKLAMTRAALWAANPGVNTEALRHGQVLNVP